MLLSKYLAALRAQRMGAPQRSIAELEDQGSSQRVGGKSEWSLRDSDPIHQKSVLRYEDL